jgi:hypothetical protein
MLLINKIFQRSNQNRWYINENRSWKFGAANNTFGSSNEKFNLVVQSKNGKEFG